MATGTKERPRLNVEDGLVEKWKTEADRQGLTLSAYIQKRLEAPPEEAHYLLILERIDQLVKLMREGQRETLERVEAMTSPKVEAVSAGVGWTADGQVDTRNMDPQEYYHMACKRELQAMTSERDRLKKALSVALDAWDKRPWLSRLFDRRER